MLCVRPPWYLRSSIVHRGEAQVPVRGEVVLACCYVLHHQTGQLGTAWPFLVQWGRRIKYTSVGAGKEERTTEHVHHVD